MGAATGRDRAAVAATGILQIVNQASQEQLRLQLEDFLRTEFDDVARQVAADRRLVD
jgi:hypothetical protein